MGGGQGLKEMLNKNFEGFAQNTAMIWAQQTTKPYKGFRKGRWWAMEYRDIERLRQRVPELDVIAPVLFGSWGTTNTAYYGDQKTQPHIQGVTPDYADIVAPRMYYGRYINEMDLRQHRKVCVLGKKIYKDLFKEGGDPCGKSIRIDSTYYEVVGVDYNASGSMNFNGRAEEKVTLPLTLVQKTFNRGNQVDLIAVTGRQGVVMSKITPRIRETIARSHYIDPTDEQGVMVFNTGGAVPVARQPLPGCQLPHLARRLGHTPGRGHRRVEHHDGHRARAYHGDRHPPCHRGHAAHDSLADHL